MVPKSKPTLWRREILVVSILTNPKKSEDGITSNGFESPSMEAEREDHPNPA